MAKSNTRAGTVAGDLGSIAEDTASVAKEEASRRADSAKTSVADEIGGVASAMRKASGEFKNESMQARAFRQLADGLGDASESLRNKDLGEMMHGINRFARQHPATFLGAAALLGFAASRFAGASDTGRDARQNEQPVRTKPPD